MTYSYCLVCAPRFTYEYSINFRFLHHFCNSCFFTHHLLGSPFKTISLTSSRLPTLTRLILRIPILLDLDYDCLSSSSAPFSGNLLLATLWKTPSESLTRCSASEYK